MSEGGFRIAADVNHSGVEQSQFPILCETCLGDNPYVRMIRSSHADKECKICSRPYNGFRWQPGRKARFKTTIVCQTCAKLKNVCQTCLFDLEFGLPVQVRDRYLSEQSRLEMPTSQVNRDFQTAQFEKLVDQQQAALTYGRSAPHPMLQKMARTAPYYKRNRARVCTFWQRGECSRGDQCPFRHEEDEHDPALADQNIKDRYHGQDDPVAQKMLARSDQFAGLKPPEDKSITTLYLGSLATDTTENDIRDNFYAFGEIRSIKMMPRQACAFVTFTTRAAAEEAIAQHAAALMIRGTKVRLMWGRPNTAGTGSDSSAVSAAAYAF